MFKVLLFAFTSFLITMSSFSQIPNSSFELWTDSLPDDWVSNSSPPALWPIMRSSDSHSGTYALKGQVVDDAGVPFAPYLFPFTTGYGFPCLQQHSNLSGWYKSSNVSTDQTLVEIYVYNSIGVTIGSGSVTIATSGSYRQFNVPISYLPGTVPAEASIFISIIDSLGLNQHVGSYFIVDDLSFTSSTTEIFTPAESAFKIYPNPSTDYFKIEGTAHTEAGARLEIIDIAGRLIKSFEMNNADGSNSSYDVSLIAAGVYTVKVRSGKKVSFADRLIITK